MTPEFSPKNQPSPTKDEMSPPPQQKVRRENSPTRENSTPHHPQVALRSLFLSLFLFDMTALSSVLSFVLSQLVDAGDVAPVGVCACVCRALRSVIYGNDDLWSRALLSRCPGTARLFEPFELPKGSALRSLAQLRLHEQVEPLSRFVDCHDTTCRYKSFAKELEEEYRFELTISTVGGQVAFSATFAVKQSLKNPRLVREILEQPDSDEGGYGWGFALYRTRGMQVHVNA